MRRLLPVELPTKSVYTGIIHVYPISPNPKEVNRLVKPKGPQSPSKRRSPTFSDDNPPGTGRTLDIPLTARHTGAAHADNVSAPTRDTLDSLSFILTLAEHVSGNDQEWTLRLQFLKTHLLVYVASGHGWLTIDGRFVELRQSTLYILRPGQLVEASVQELDNGGLYVLHTELSDATRQDSANDPVLERANSPFPIDRESLAVSPVAIGTLCEHICRQWSSRDALTRFRARISFHELLLALFQDALASGASDVEQALEEARLYIEAHYRDELAIGQLAGVARLSPRHFMRLFKKRYGCSAIEYVAAHRIKQAQLLMQSGQTYRIKDIAKHVGYPDELYFRRKFKRISGVTPAAFMKTCKQSIIACDDTVIGILLALHIIPGGAPADHPWTGYYKRKYETARVIALSAEPAERLDQLRLAAPDYIVGMERQSDTGTGQQAALEAIAPTLLLSMDTQDWRKQLRLTAAFLGRTPLAEAWLSRYERKADTVRTQLKKGTQQTRLLPLRIEGRQLSIPGRFSIAAVLYEDLGFQPADGVRPDEPGRTIEAAKLEELHTEHVLFIVDDDPLSQATLRELMRREPWCRQAGSHRGLIDVLPSYPWTSYCAFVHDLLLDESLKLWQDRT